MLEVEPTDQCGKYTARVLANQAEAIVRPAKHGHKLLNGGTKHRINIH